MVKTCAEILDDDTIFRDFAILFEQVNDEMTGTQIQQFELNQLNEDVIPIFPLSLRINQTPFNKTHIEVEKETNLIEENDKNSWMRIWYDEKTLQQVLNYCKIEEWQNLMKCSRRFYKQIQIIKLRISNTWCFSQYRIQKYLLSDVYLQYSSIEEESQHSLDLDRTFTFLQSDHIDNQLRLDRVLRALSFSVGYFQGLNSITAVLLQFYQEQEVYWLIRYLLHQSNNLQNNNDNYANYINQIDFLISQKQPKVYEHIHNNCFNVEYFAMRWILALFSYDSQPQLLLELWDLIMNYGIKMLTLFICQIIGQLKDKILLSCGNQLNDFLKYNFKQNIKSINKQQMIQNIKRKYKDQMIKPNLVFSLEQLNQNQQRLSERIQSYD